VKKKIDAWRKHVQARIDYWVKAEACAAAAKLDADAAWCAYLRSHFEELLQCLDELERAAA